MTFGVSIRSLTLASTAVAILGLSACASQSGASRYGDCSEPCMQTSQQPAYMESYFQVPVAPLPAPIPAPAPDPVYVPQPAPPVTIAPPPAISCPSATKLQDDGTCLQYDVPVYDIPAYIPPVVGYTPDPVAPPKVYTPIRK